MGKGKKATATVIRAGATRVQSLDRHGLSHLYSPESVRYTLHLESVSKALDDITAILNPLAEDIGRTLDTIYGRKGNRWS